MQVGTKSNLFPLNLVYGNLTGHWIDSKGNIWSTRQKAEPQPMKTTLSGSIQLCLRSHNARRLLLTAKRHGLWRTHTEPAVAKVVAKVVAKPVATTTTTNAKAPSGWIIGTLNGASFSFAESPKVHDTLMSVSAELERLAKSKPGVTFVSLKVDRSATAGGVVWG